MAPVLRRAWLIGLVIAAVIGGGGALVMRFELFDPGGTLSPELYSTAFSLHAVALTGMVVAALILVPTLILEPTRAVIVLGALAFMVWAAVMAYLLAVSYAPEGASPASLHAAFEVLAVAVGLAVVQLLAALQANRNRERPRALVTVGSIIGLAIIALPLAHGGFPHRMHLVIACTLVAGSVIPIALASVASTLVWSAALPCLAAAWITSAVLEAVHVQFLPDTVAIVSPLPALGGAILAAVLVAAAQGRTLLLRRAQIAALLVAVGSIATSTGFLILGLRGLPRRYQQYDDIFQPLQVVVGIAAAVTVLGAVLALRSTRPAK